LQKVNKLSKSWTQFYNVNIQSSSDQLFVEADDFALELIIKNMFENTKHHSQSKNVSILFIETNDHIELLYKDEGKFTGDVEKLGSLFYKHNSSKGSGIGLYLSKLLMEKMGGRLCIRQLPEQTLEFSFLFKKSEDLHA
jgi:K+-sensing histidine kinase KdpD